MSLPSERLRHAALDASRYAMPPSISIRLTAAELDLITDALARTASRCESEARCMRRGHGKHHETKAMRLRSLRMRLLQHKNGAQS